MKVTSPSHLSDAAKHWFREIAEAYAITDRAGLLLLQQAAEAWDRAAECREAIARDGSTTRDRFGQVRAHPLLAAERDARAGFLAAVKHLQLDVAAVPQERKPHAGA
jgi:P27 family predicted phage terminase small subunit